MSDYDDSSSCRGSDDEEDLKIMTGKQKSKKRNRGWEDDSVDEEQEEEDEDEDEGEEAMLPPPRPPPRGVTVPIPQVSGLKGILKPPPPKRQKTSHEPPTEDDDFLDSFLEEDGPKATPDTTTETGLDAFLDGLLGDVGVNVGQLFGKGTPAPTPAEHRPETEAEKLEKILKEKGLVEDGEGGLTTLISNPEWKPREHGTAGFSFERREPPAPPPVTEETEAVPEEFDMFGSDDEADQGVEERAGQLKEEGNELVKKGSVDEAIEKYTEAIGLPTKEKHVLYSNRSNAYLMKGDAARSFLDAAMAIVENPGWFKGYLRKALAAKKVGGFAEADSVAKIGLVHCNDVISRDAVGGVVSGNPDSLSEPNFLLKKRSLAASATTAFKDKSYPAALEGYAQALAIDPSDPSLLLNRSATLIHMKRYSQALADATLARRITPKNPKAYLRQATALKSMNRFEDAMEAVQDGLRSVPNDAQLVETEAEVKKSMESRAKMDHLFK